MNYIKRLVINTFAKMGLNYFGSSKSISKIKKNKKNNKLLILGTGPSLKNINKEIFNHVDTLSVNGYAKLVDENNWPSPTYYIVQDLEVVKKIEPYISNLNSIIITSSYIFFKNVNIRKYIHYIFNHNFMDHVFKNNYFPLTYKKTHNADKFINDGYTVVYTAIELAEYLGYEEIYLLGVDATYSKDIKERNIVNINKIDETYESAGERIIFSIKNYSKSQSMLKIYNCSISGRLDFLKFSSEIDGVKICM